MHGLFRDTAYLLTLKRWCRHTRKSCAKYKSIENPLSNFKLLNSKVNFLVRSNKLGDCGRLIANFRIEWFSQKRSSIIWWMNCILPKKIARKFDPGWCLWSTLKIHKIHCKKDRNRKAKNFRPKRPPDSSKKSNLILTQLPSKTYRIRPPHNISRKIYCETKSCCAHWMSRFSVSGLKSTTTIWRQKVLFRHLMTSKGTSTTSNQKTRNWDKKLHWWLIRKERSNVSSLTYLIGSRSIWLVRNIILLRWSRSMKSRYRI